MSEDKGCRDLLGKILSYIDGDVEGSACDELRDHLAACTDCSACLEIIMKTISLCGGRTALSDEAREKLAASIRREIK